MSGLDELNDYYDLALKRARLALLTPDPGFGFTHRPGPPHAFG